MRKILTIIGGFVVLAIAGIALIFFLSAGLTKVADQFFSHVSAGNYDKAYELVSSGFKAETSLEEMKDFLASSALTFVNDTNWNSRSVATDGGTIEGTVKNADGGSIPLKIDFVKENGNWHIHGINRAPAGANIEGDADSGDGSSTTPAKLPSEEEQIALVRESMMAFAQAVNAKDFTDFHKGVAEVWRKKVTVERLNGAFAIFTTKEIDLVPPLKNLSPAFDEAPTLDEGGLMTIKGHYPSTPSKIFFDLGYIKEGLSWKLVDIGVNLRE